MERRRVAVVVRPAEDCVVGVRVVEETHHHPIGSGDENTPSAGRHRCDYTERGVGEELVVRCMCHHFTTHIIPLQDGRLTGGLPKVSTVGTASGQTCHYVHDALYVYGTSDPIYRGRPPDHRPDQDPLVQDGQHHRHLGPTHPLHLHRSQLVALPRLHQFPRQLPPKHHRLRLFGGGVGRDPLRFPVLQRQKRHFFGSAVDSQRGTWRSRIEVLVAAIRSERPRDPHVRHDL